LLYSCDRVVSGTRTYLANQNQSPSIRAAVPCIRESAPNEISERASPANKDCSDARLARDPGSILLTGATHEYNESKMSETVMKIDAGKFQNEVVKSQLPVVVDFYADWCGPCKMVSPIIEQLAKEFEGKAKFVKINTDDNQELAAQFGIMSIPTIMFFAKGKVEDIVVGAASAGVFKSKLQSLV
jgi:thioredoxin 1